MPKITFIEYDGQKNTVEAEAGHSMMLAAANNGITSIVAECGGNCACGTCRVYLDDIWKEKIPPAQSIEREMLDCAEDDNQGVRLSCQIVVTDELDGIEVRVPESQYQTY